MRVSWQQLSIHIATERWSPQQMWRCDTIKYAPLITAPLHWFDWLEQLLQHTFDTLLCKRDYWLQSTKTRRRHVSQQNLFAATATRRSSHNLSTHLQTIYRHLGGCEWIIWGWHLVMSNCWVLVNGRSGQLGVQDGKEGVGGEGGELWLLSCEWMNLCGWLWRLAKGAVAGSSASWLLG